MSIIDKLSNEELNQRYLTAAVGGVRESIIRYINHSAQHHNDANLEEELANIRHEMQFTPPLEIICEKFGLSGFERDILLLCAGVELDSSLTDLLQKTGDHTRKVQPTFGLALAAFPEAHWSALSPAAALRYRRLIEVNNTEGLTTSPLKIDECILHYLTGLRYYDERINSYIKSVPFPGLLVPSHQAIIKQAAAAYDSASRENQCPLLQFYGNDPLSQHHIAAAFCNITGSNLKLLNAQIIPRELRELEALSNLWDRQAAVTQSILLLDCNDIENTDHAEENTVRLFIRAVQSAIIVAGRERRALPDRPSISFEVRKPTAAEQLNLWQKLLPDENLNGELQTMVSQFDLNLSSINSVCGEALKRKDDNDAPDFKNVLWDVCRLQSRKRLDELAQRINSTATINDLVLPAVPHQLINEIAAQVRRRLKVYETWGFSSRMSRGLGITALFAGPSGTGKTMAAEVLANELRLDLFRIDLSSVVSKYIGETEKNLRRVFDAAEDGGAILLFDEADALFGKRSEVKDSHDRYANIEVSYLLQRMEDYKGLAILTTNMKEALDAAFLRRIRFMVQFPFPNIEQRKEIWRRIFPTATPTEGLDADKLARLNISGGNIKNIALYAAFLAADAGQPVRMEHLLRAARVEHNKLEMALTDSVIRDWV
jgi:hypothetical protein